MRLGRTIRSLGALIAVLAASAVNQAVATADTVTTYRGDLDDGAAYVIEVPANWNHTLLLYSHGYYSGPANPAQDGGDPVTHDWLLSQGYALAGSSYASAGWAVESALADQVAVLDVFDSLIGRHPDRTIAWGHSMGGLVTAGLVQAFPGRFTAAMPLCGWVSGGPAIWNQHLDAAFAFKTLVAPESALELTNITDPANLGLAETLLNQAQAEPAGRARIALMSAFAQIPGWQNPTGAEPPAHDFTARENNQFLWNRSFAFPITFLARAELEARAGGNPSWNTGVDYRRQLSRSGFREEVEALYRAAHLDLDSDLARLASAPRISASPVALEYLSRAIAIDGSLNGVPVLTMHTIGDGLVPVTNEQAYAQAVDEADGENNLRQLFVHRAGHCTLTPAETITAFQALIRRVDTGRWSISDPERMNRDAQSLGADYNQLVPFQFAPFGPAPGIGPAFVRYHPAPFLRPFAPGEDNRD